jgi:hypothetical protein
VAVRRAEPRRYFTSQRAKRTRQAKLGVRLDLGHDLPEHLRRDDVDLVEENEPPFARGEEIHHLLSVVRALLPVGDHRIGRDDDARGAGELSTGLVDWRSRQRRASPRTCSLVSAVKTAIWRSLIVDHFKNSWRHWLTLTLEVHRTMHDFLMVQAAVMPTSVLPAPQGRTMMPERARLCEG